MTGVGVGVEGCEQRTSLSQIIQETKERQAAPLSPLSLFVSCRVQTSQHQEVAFVAS